MLIVIKITGQIVLLSWCL